MVANAVRGNRPLSTVLLGVFALLTGTLAAGCGQARQDAHESKGTFTVRVVQSRFPSKQAVARRTQLVLDVRNTSKRTLPDVTVAVNSFSYTSNYPNLASRKRPVWIVDDGPGAIPKPPVETVQIDPPGGGTTATDNIWALGRLAPGAERRFVWNLTPVKPGTHRVSYRVYAGLNGKAQAQLAGGGVPEGHFTVHIAGRPPGTHVNPETGAVAAGAYSPAGL
jgi:hypothetical protein